MSHLDSIPEVCKLLLEKKKQQGLTFEQIATSLKRDEVFVAAIFYGQAKPEKEDVDALAKLLSGSDSNLVNQLNKSFNEEEYYPVRGATSANPITDPLIYRLYEMILVYGQPFKHIIQEKFGDGIMSAIDFTAHIDKVEDPKGDRVQITLNGKFLPFKKW